MASFFVAYLLGRLAPLEALADSGDIYLQHDDDHGRDRHGSGGGLARDVRRVFSVGLLSNWLRLPASSPRS